jgi:hypothetical protein
MLVDLWFRTMQELWDNVCRASFRALPPHYQQKVMEQFVKDKNISIMSFQPHLMDMPNIPGC